MAGAKAVTVKEALEQMASADNSIVEIDAMIPRLLKMKKQLIAQKEYIEVAVKDTTVAKSTSNAPSLPTLSADTDYSGTSPTTALKAGSNIVDYRVKLFKHRALVTRLKDARNSDTMNGVLDDVFSDGVNAAGDIAKTDEGMSGANETSNDKGTEFINALGRAVKSGGVKDAAIFKLGQFIPIDGAVDNAADAATTAAAVTDKKTNDIEYTNGDVFNGVDLECTNKFLIGVNAILTHPNDIASTGIIDSTPTHTVAIGSIVGGGTAASLVTAPDNEINPNTYIAGNKHLLTAGTIRGLVMQTNKNVSVGTLPTDLTNPASATDHNTAMTGLRGFGL